MVMMIIILAVCFLFYKSVVKIVRKYLKKSCVFLFALIINYILLCTYCKYEAHLFCKPRILFVLLLYINKLCWVKKRHKCWSCCCSAFGGAKTFIHKVQLIGCAIELWDMKCSREDIDSTFCFLIKDIFVFLTFHPQDSKFDKTRK